MKQVFLSGKGQVELFDVPVPGRMKGSILVQNAFSLISAGTEGGAITKSSGIIGLYEKIVKSRDKANQVWQMVQSQGLSSTLGLIKNKLGDYTPLGYSCSGVVLEVEDEHLGFQPRQRVACMGTGFANHAEYVVIPKNLAVALPQNVSFEDASFAALGCIAMQGIRRLELSPGEFIAVVGLGLIGQIVLRLAKAMGYQVCGFDIDERRVEHARQHGAANVMSSIAGDPVSMVMDLTSGTGADGVIICASSKEDSIINQSFRMCRKRGRVSVVGDVGLKLERARMYAKELEVRLSCSYGVGRYDPEYELKGIDYPLPYVRWTERRNLEYLLRLLAEGQIGFSDLVSAKISINKASRAYSLIKSGNSGVYGVLLDYHLPHKASLPNDAFICKYEEKAQAAGHDVLRIGMIGVGGYAKNVHVPNIMASDNMEIRALASKSGTSAAVIAKKVKAVYATSDIAKMLSDTNLDAVVISTRHATHAKFAVEALEAGKHVFVEKPLAITVEDCWKVVEAQQKANRIVRVGFNRRFSPFLNNMKHAVGKGKKIFTMRVNTGDIGAHWSNTVEEGGRLLGEGVHFFDLANWVMDCKPLYVVARFLGEPDLLNPNVSVSISYEDGSLANITYVTVGHSGRGKEFFELFGNGRTVVVDDYKVIKSYGCKVTCKRKDKGNKGQKEAMQEFATASLTGNGGGGADAMAGLLATAICKAVLRSAITGKAVNILSIMR